MDWNIYVRKRGDSGRYQLVMRYKDARGRWRQRAKSLPERVDTEAKARRQIPAWRAELEAEDARQDEREAVSGPEPGETVSQYIAEWYGALEGSRSVRESTLRGYRTNVRRASAEIGGMRLADVTEADVQAMVNSLNASLSPRSVRKTIDTLSRVFEHAVRNGVVPANPCRGVARPRVPVTEKNSLTVSDYVALVGELSRMRPTRLVTAALMALTTGIREGEVCALRWSDVDTGSGELTISHGITASEVGTELGETKRLASNRTIPIGSTLSGMLARRRALMRDEADVAGIPVSKRGGLFVIGDETGAYCEPDRICREWRQFADAHGLVGLAGRRPTFHDLRHTYATVAIASGADVMAVSSYLGHADPHVTLRTYANADPDAKRRTAELMDRLARDGRTSG